VVLCGSCTTLIGAQDPVEVFSTSDASATDSAADADAGDVPAYRSGSRLRAQLVKADGVALFVGWHDKGPNDVDCSFELADDGRTRCLPGGPDVASLGSYYADAGCTIPAVTATAGCSAPRFAVSQASGMCATTVWSLGAGMPVPAVYQKDPGGSCSSVDSLPPGTVYPISTPIPAAQFVAAASMRRSRGPDLAVEWLQGDDGSLQASSLFDTKRGASCGQSSQFPGRCVPDGLAFIIGDYADPSCSVPAAWAEPPTACVPAPTAVIDEGSPGNPVGCVPPPPTLSELGPMITSTIYGNNGGGMACAPAAIGNAEAFAVGAPIPPAALPALVPRDDGAGRIRLRTLTSSDGESLFATTLFDSQRREECAPAYGADGTLRCIPYQDYPYLGTSYYADAACTVPLEQTMSGCAPPAFVYTSAPSSNVCSPYYAAAVYQVGARQSLSTIYYSTGNGTCMQQSASGFDYYLATPVPPSAFETVQTVTE
jgi:hypothetical protein